MKTLTILGCATVVVVSTGCSTFSMEGSGGEYFSMRGTPAGLQAYDEMLSGLVTNGKASADAPTTPYYETRKVRIATQYRGLQLGKKEIEK